MKTIYLSLALLIPTTTVFCTKSNHSMSIQTNIVQMKLKNDTNEKFVYYVNGTKYEMEPMTRVGLSFPENTVVKIIDTKTKKEKELFTMSLDRNVGSFLVSEIKK
jgi:hypothetical protein